MAMRIFLSMALLAATFGPDMSGQTSPATETQSLTAEEQLRIHGFAVDPRIPTADEELTTHHIGLDKRSIVWALSDRDNEVRAMAAMALADRRAIDEVPSILNALRSERVPEVELIMSVALAWLGEQKGVTSLKSFCQDKTQTPTVRLGAAQDMLVSLRNEDCVDAVLDIAQTSAEGYTKEHALGVLSSFRSTFQKDPEKIVGPIVSALSDSNPQVRINAAWALQNLGAVSAIPSLQAALSRESEEPVREGMKFHLRILVDLQTLQKPNTPQ